MLNLAIFVMQFEVYGCKKYSFDSLMSVAVTPKDYHSCSDSLSCWVVLLYFGRSSEEAAVNEVFYSDLKFVSAIFYQISIFLPNDSSLKIMKNVCFYI